MAPLQTGYGPNLETDAIGVECDVHGSIYGLEHKQIQEKKRHHTKIRTHINTYHTKIRTQINTYHIRIRTRIYTDTDTHIHISH